MLLRFFHFFTRLKKDEKEKRRKISGLGESLSGEGSATHFRWRFDGAALKQGEASATQ
jgi:hypothetical protein